MSIFSKAQQYDLTPHERETLEHERTKNEAMVNLYKGKQAFVSGNFDDAVVYLKRANSFLKSRKLTAVTTTLRLAPQLLLRVHNLRSRC